jgi:hypothetical protein
MASEMPERRGRFREIALKIGYEKGVNNGSVEISAIALLFTSIGVAGFLAKSRLPGRRQHAAPNPQFMSGAISHSTGLS